MECEAPQSGYATSGDYLRRQAGGQHEFLCGASVLPLEIFLMADQGQWFKLWVGADDDPDLGNLSLEDFGRWCRLGIYLKKHGTNGTVSIKAPAFPLQQRFRVQDYAGVLQVLRSFPNCAVEERQNGAVSGETILTVSLRNWSKYQGDFSTARVRKFRQMKRSKRRGEEKRGEEKKKEPPPTPPSTTALNGEPPWGTPETLVALYNASIPVGHPAVTKFSPARRQKALAYLRQFPDPSFWRQVMSQIGCSRFLTHGSKEHPSFRGDFDWLLTKGKDGTENVVKVYEGRYRDQHEEEDD